MSGPVLVTGASGFIGNALVHRLAAGGYAVRALSRSGAVAGQSTLPGVSQHRYEIGEDPDPALLDGVVAAVHTAWTIQDQTVEAADRNVRAAESLGAVCREHGARAIFVSSFAADVDALSLYGRSKLRAESAFTGMQDVILKPGLVAGPGGMFLRLSEAVRSRRILPLIGARRPLQVIGIDDLLDAIAGSLHRPRGGTFWFAQPVPIAVGDLYRVLAERALRPPVLVPIPIPLALAAARAAERLGIHLPVSPDSVLGLKRARVRETRADLIELGGTVEDPVAVVRRYSGMCVTAK